MRKNIAQYRGGHGKTKKKTENNVPPEPKEEE